MTEKQTMKFKKLKSFILIPFILLCGAVSQKAIAQQDSIRFQNFLNVLDSFLRKSFPPERELSKSGAKQTYIFHYDGENLNIRWEISGSDTCEFIKDIITHGHADVPVNDFGSVTQHENQIEFYNCKSDDKIEKVGSVVKYMINLCDVSLDVNGYDSLIFDLPVTNTDSVVFIYSGNDELELPAPPPLFYKSDTIIWGKRDLKIQAETVSFKLRFRGLTKSFLSFSRHSIKSLNEKCESHFDQLVRSLLFTIPFWILWIYCFAYKKRLRSNIPEITDRILKWLPILSGFYFVIAYMELFYFLDDTPLGVHIEEQNITMIKYRIIGLAIAIMLIIVARYYRKNKDDLLLSLFKRLAQVSSWSFIAFVALGIINYGYERLLPYSDMYTFSHSMSLWLYFKYPYGLLVPGTLFFFVCSYNLLRHIRLYLLLTLAILATLFISQMYLSFDIPTARKTGTSLSGLFLIHFYLLSIVPLLLSALFLGRVQNNSPSLGTMVFLSGMYLLIFCIYAIPSYQTLFCMPLTFLFGLFISKYLFISLRDRYRVLSIKEDLFRQERDQLRQLFEVKWVEKLKNKYQNRFLAGEIDITQRNNSIGQLEKRIGREYSTKLLPVISRRLEFGTHHNDITNALTGSVVAFIISLLIRAIYFRNYIASDSGHDMVDVYFPSLGAGLGGYCLGLFLPYFRGNSGWKKGLGLGLSIVLVSMPYTYVTAEYNVVAKLVFSLANSVLIFVLTGFLSFDLPTIHSIYGRALRPRHIIDILGAESVIKFFLSVGTACLASFMSTKLSALLETIPK